jgi:hypothetical protein
MAAELEGRRGAREATSEIRKHAMRIMIKFSFPVESGNSALRSGESRKSLPPDPRRPEAGGGLLLPGRGRKNRPFRRANARFVADGGHSRTFLFGLNATESI